LLLQSLVLATLLLLSPTTLNAAVGTVTEQTGPTEIKRKAETIPSQTQLGIEMQDVITTANAKAGITFQDDTRVQITEHSKLVIDNFVYDGEKKTGKLGIKMALGTVKYASGQIAKNDPQQVVVTTPTATIGVRGTDFSSTVDELGRSQIILLPSCPAGWKNIDKDCVTGKISVTTDMGTILLTKAFEAVTVDTNMTRPQSAGILNLDLNQINNMLIVTPPKVVADTSRREEKKAFNFLDEDLLKKDHLKYDELERDLLKEFNKLDRDFLGTDYLYNFMDVIATQLLDNALDEFGQLLPKYNQASGLKYFVENETLTLYRETVSSFAEVSMQTTRAGTVNIIQEGITVKQMVNHAGSTTITIKQSN
jgi:hypothetical protein